MANVKYINKIEQLTKLSPKSIKELAEVTSRYDFRANDYYLSLINWDDPDDPIRKIVVPDLAELNPAGKLDASDEETNYVVQGTQHKYPDTALLLCCRTCGAVCRFCFRKRIFMEGDESTSLDVSAGIEYIRQHKEISNVLLTGGDPLLLSTKRLERIIVELRKIDHISIIRIGSKIPAFNPYRIINDPSLLEMLSKYSRPDKRIWVMGHFDVWQELTEQALKGIELLLKAGVMVTNQTPLLRGINDSAEAISLLNNKLASIGVPPYYIFQCRPTVGNQPYTVPISRGYQIIQEAGRQLSGLAKRFRYVMSHASGKIEIIGLTPSQIILKYHRARIAADEGRLMIFKRDDQACWLDDLVDESGRTVADHNSAGHQDNIN